MTEAEVARVIDLLTQIRDGQRELLQALLGPTEEPPCQHPPEARKDLSSMGEVEFICGLCTAHVGPLRHGEAV